MEQSDDDISDEDSSDNDQLAVLPCDLQTWPAICSLLKELQLCRNISEIGRILADLDGIVNPSSDNDGTSKDNTIKYFLEEVCGEEERTLICNVLIPAIASLALNIYKSKPYIGVIKSGAGESEVRNIHPDFLASMLAHSFLSTTGRTSLNLNILKLDPHAAVTHWKLRCYFHYFHKTLQGRTNDHISICKESEKEKTIEDFSNFSNVTLVPFTVITESEEITDGVLRLCFYEDFSQGILPHSTPLNSDFGIKNLECIIQSLFIDDISSKESIRVSLPRNEELSFCKVPEILRTDKGLKDALQSVYVSMKPCTTHKDNLKSALRRPSVPAVTSAAESDSEENETKSSSKLSLSLSDSCINNLTDSELSYNLSEKERGTCDKEKPVRKTKIKRKDTFNERLKAALERGNTPDESDDPSANQPFNKPVQIRRVLRRQRSTGFRAFNDNVGESEEFFTATEDELSYNPVKSEKPPLMAIRNGGVNPLMRRKLLQDKSFDLSTSSAQVTSPSLPISSLQTGSSNLFSDSSSFSSEGLGMPNMDESCMEDLCDNLKGCIETSEGGLEFRNIELRRAAHSLGVRSLSETFINSIGDMDKLSSSKAIRQVYSGEDLMDKPSMKFSLSSPDIKTSNDWSPTIGSISNQFEYKAVTAHAVALTGWRKQLWPLLFYVAASSVSCVSQVTYRTLGQEGLEDLADIVDKLSKKNVKCGELIKWICEFISGKEEDLFLFLNDNLKKIE